MTPFEGLLGNDKVKDMLLALTRRGRLPHALLFSGPEGVGKGLFARHFAALLLGGGAGDETLLERMAHGSHPDYFEYRPEGKVAQHSVDAIRSFSALVPMAPQEASRKVFVFLEADRMPGVSANALLKTFEEPAADTLIILVSSAPEMMLETVLSRCQKVRFEAVSAALLAGWLRRSGSPLSDEEAMALALRARGSVARLQQLAEQGEDKLRTLTLQWLAAQPQDCYGAMLSFVAQATALIEEQCDDAVSALQWDDIPADCIGKVQQHHRQRIEEGALARRQRSGSEALLEAVEGWYRDLHLLLYGGPTTALWHSDWRDEATQALQRGALLPIEKVLKATAQARQSLQRFTPLSRCLETLFLELRRR